MHGWFSAARVAGAKGLDGKLRLADASAFLRFELSGCRVAFVPPREESPRFAEVCAIEERTLDGCIASFAGIEGIEAAQGLVGCHVLLEGQAPAQGPDEVACADLAGFAVEDRVAGLIGEVASVDADRLQPLVCVRRTGGEAEVLIPFVDDIIVHIDEDARRIVVDLPQGLLDL